MITYYCQIKMAGALSPEVNCICREQEPRFSGRHDVPSLVRQRPHRLLQSFNVDDKCMATVACTRMSATDLDPA